MPPQRASTDAARRPSALAHMPPPQRAGTDAATVSWYTCRRSALVLLATESMAAPPNTLAQLFFLHGS